MAMNKHIKIFIFTACTFGAVRAQSIAQALSQPHHYDVEKNALYLNNKQLDSWDGLEQIAARYPNTRDLYLNENRLDSPASLMALSGLTELRGLQLNGNLIRRFPDDLGTLHTLKVLAAEDNELEEFPESIMLLPHINYVYLSRNKLTAMPDLRLPRNTLEVYIYDNPLQTEPRVRPTYKVFYSPVVSPWPLSGLMQSLWPAAFSGDK